MGKIKRIRQKYHATLKKESEGESQPSVQASSDQQLKPVIETTDATSPQSDNMFAGIKIRLEGVTSSSEPAAHDDFDKMSISSALVAKQHEGVSKKERRQQRREELLKTIDTIRACEREAKERKKREKTAIVGDVHPLLNALPSLEEVLAASRQNKRPVSNKVRSTKKQKKATEEICGVAPKKLDLPFNVLPIDGCGLSAWTTVHSWLGSLS
ncbi:ribosome biogenesis protein SLX9 homolog isoform X2 [Macrobrachium rosenbergii]|uniref:ribosome biogenesis protein SLX9 homolog isoform X2 n=1 Tax=Macrobrachium rosenbergii TaxID=79674 RepID=UPI0034D722FD